MSFADDEKHSGCASRVSRRSPTETESVKHDESNAMPESSFENPCELVRRSCREWTEQGSIVNRDDDDDDDDDDGNRTRRSSVTVRREKLRGLADEILEVHRRRKQQQEQEQLPLSSPREDHSGGGDNNEVEDDDAPPWIQWDAEEWHYTGKGFRGTETDRRNRVALYLLALDAINFCFWPLPEDDDDVVVVVGSKPTRTNPLEYDHLAMAMKSMAEADHGGGGEEEEEGDRYAFSPESLASTTVERMARLFDVHMPDPARHRLPNLTRRAALWRELGVGLLEHHHRRSNDAGGPVALRFLEAAGGDASEMVRLVAETFSGFRDEVYLDAATTDDPPRRVVFLKRAQILVGDLNAALDLDLRGMDRLTTFADYRVPQLLRHRGVLAYEDDLGERVDALREIPRGSPDEVSIRAATVVAVEELVTVLNATGGGGSRHRWEPFTDVAVDWHLWQVGEILNREGRMKPFHRVRTDFY